jgi:hypothetical protein
LHTVFTDLWPWRGYVAAAFGGYLVWRLLPWWIAAFRVAITRDPDKAKIARKALRAIAPSWHWIWQKRD